MDLSYRGYGVEHWELSPCFNWIKKLFQLHNFQFREYIWVNQLLFIFFHLISVGFTRMCLLDNRGILNSLPQIYYGVDE